MDTNGYVVTVQTPFEGAKEAAYLATAGADPLVSQFTPTYGMVLNLLQTHSLPEAKELVERSFAQYLATLYLKPQQQAITELTAELTRIDFQLAPVDVAVMEGYQKLKEHLKVERRILKDLQHQAEASVSKAVSQLLQQVQPGVTPWVAAIQPDMLSILKLHYQHRNVGMGANLSKLVAVLLIFIQFHFFNSDNFIKAVFKYLVKDPFDSSASR